MRKQISSIVLTLLVFCAAIAYAKTNRDAADIRALTEKAAASWNAGGAATIASLWAEDGDLIDVSGNRTTGRAEIQKRFAGALGGAYKGSRLSLEADTIRFVQPAVAVVDGHFELEGGHGADGKALPAEKGLYTDVITKKSGKWEVASHREMIPAS
jgi:uncharacterized protein (TIGR02246 family)